MTQSQTTFISLLALLIQMINLVNSRDVLQNASDIGSFTADRSSSPTKLLTNFIPVSMHLLHHCIESIQYEPVGTITTTTSTTTTLKPTTSNAAPPTTFHKPGYFGPEKPPATPPSIFGANIQEHTTPASSPEITDTLLWNDKQFFEWFLQNKYKQVKLRNDYNPQLLDPLPLQLLQDIDAEQYELPALLDKDNVNEFRKIYDENYQETKRDYQLPASTPKTGNTKLQQTIDHYRSPIDSGAKSSNGKKRVPPTKPYIHMLMLYDLLKREAKKFMFNLYEGYSNEILKELSQFNAENGQQQLLFVLSRMLEEKNIEKRDIVSRTEVMIADLKNPNSALSNALIYVPPLKFLL